jgi:probable F420-dependent oxidoreductase
MDLNLGTFGIWTFDFDHQPIALVREEVAELEELGYGTIWIPEVAGREALSHAALLLAATTRIVIANGIARIGERSPRAMVAAQKAFAEAYPGRYLLGLGVGRVEDPSNRVEEMRAYLDAMDSATTVTPTALAQPERLLAAYGPAMLRLASQRSAGAHTYKGTPEHTAFARQILGPDAFLAVEQAVVFERDSRRARAIARSHLEMYFHLAPHLAKWRRLGFTESDFASGGSDKLVDALIAWGDLNEIVARLHSHLEAGADHVGIHVIGIAPGLTARREWRWLAEALLH